jgi:hypothetical protein
MPSKKTLPVKKILIPIVVVVVVIGVLAAAGYYYWTQRGTPDKTPPEISLTSPTSEDWYSTNEDKISIEGLVGDESGIKSISWKVGGDKSGSATISDDNWKVEDTPLTSGDNKITIEAADNKGNTSELVLNVVYNPDIAFYDLTLSQDYIYKDEPSVQITARAGVETEKKEGVGKVYLYKIANDEKEKLVEMLDNGSVSNGDDIPGDGVFSGVEPFSSSTSGTILLRVGATIGSSTTVSYSGVIKLTVLNKLSQAQVSKMISTNKEINDKFEELKDSKSAQDAAKELAEFVSQKEEVAVAGTSEDGYGVWWEFKGTGILGGVQNNPKDTKGPTDAQFEARRKALEKEENVRRGREQVKGLSIGLPSPAIFGPSPAYAAEEATKLEVKSTKALYLGPFLNDFGNGDDYHGAWEVIKKSKCPECQTVEKKNKEVKVEDFKTLSNYGLVVVSSHGDTWFNGQFAASCNGNCPEGLQNRRGKVITYTNQQVDGLNLIPYLPDLLMQRLALDSTNTLVVLPSYIKRYNGTFPNSLVYISTCRSFHNFSLAIAFLSKGAKAYYGYDEYVFVSYAKKAGEAMMKSFINSGKTATESFKDAVASAGANDGGVPPAAFRFWGWPTVKMGGKDIQNAGFEDRLVGWQAEGDARVINRLASLTPREGNKMAIISTGLGSVYDSNSALSQKICSKEGTPTLSFKYDVVSEEPMEWVNTAYDDNFTMIVSINNKKTTLVRRTINNSSWRKIGGIDFAGGDNTTYHTGWKTISRALGKVEPDDTILIEFRVSDKGDSIYDTATLIDDVKLEVN